MSTSPSAAPSPPPPATIPQSEVDDLRAAWSKNANDLGVGLINICTGEIHVGSFTTKALSMGHDGLQMTLGFPDAERPQWRGFGISSNGQPLNGSGFNHIDGTPPRMHPVYWAAVEDALRQAGLI